MFKPENYLEATINDIVFENRNKEYGAYQLRRDGNKFMTYALVLGISAAAVIGFLALRSSRHQVEDTIITIISDVTDIEKLKLPELPKLKAQQPESPKTQAVEQPTVQHTEYRVVDQTSTTAVTPTPVSDLKDRIIGTKTNTLPPGIKGSVLTQPTNKQPEVVKDKPLEFVEQPPVFIGGFEAMQKFIAKHIEYPSYAQSIGMGGTVYVSLVINTDGTVSDVQVVRGVGYGLDEAAVDVVSSMPAWQPGVQNKNKVRVKTVIPIMFQVEN